VAEPAKAVAEWIKENFELETVESAGLPCFPIWQAAHRIARADDGSLWTL